MGAGAGEEQKVGGGGRGGDAGSGGAHGNDDEATEAHAVYVGGGGGDAGHELENASAAAPLSKRQRKLAAVKARREAKLAKQGARQKVQTRLKAGSALSFVDEIFEAFDYSDFVPEARTRTAAPEGPEGWQLGRCRGGSDGGGGGAMRRPPLMPLPKTFSSWDHYRAAFQPLLLAEALAVVSQAAAAAAAQTAAGRSRDPEALPFPLQLDSVAEKVDERGRCMLVAAVPPGRMPRGRVLLPGSVLLLVGIGASALPRPSGTNGRGTNGRGALGGFHGGFRAVGGDGRGGGNNVFAVAVVMPQARAAVRDVPGTVHLQALLDPDAGGDLLATGSSWTALPVASVLHLQRMYAALLDPRARPPFLDLLWLRACRRSHIRFGGSDEESSDDGGADGGGGGVGGGCGGSDRRGGGRAGGDRGTFSSSSSSRRQRMPRCVRCDSFQALNVGQRAAVESFVSSTGPSAGLQLLQGPPGTGKTCTIVALLLMLLDRRCTKAAAAMAAAAEAGATGRAAVLAGATGVGKAVEAAEVAADAGEPTNASSADRSSSAAATEVASGATTVAGAGDVVAAAAVATAASATGLATIVEAVAVEATSAAEVRFDPNGVVSALADEVWSEPMEEDDFLDKSDAEEFDGETEEALGEDVRAVARAPADGAIETAAVAAARRKAGAVAEAPLVAVCAPSNKAVRVVLQEFLKALARPEAAARVARTAALQACIAATVAGNPSDCDEETAASADASAVASAALRLSRKDAGPVAILIGVDEGLLPGASAREVFVHAFADVWAQKLAALAADVFQPLTNAPGWGTGCAEAAAQAAATVTALVALADAVVALRRRVPRFFAQTLRPQLEADALRATAMSA
ncbi:unnamed protein product, partial [Phaeothamnion confervicola]